MENSKQSLKKQLFTWSNDFSNLPNGFVVRQWNKLSGFHDYYNGRLTSNGKIDLKIGEPYLRSSLEANGFQWLEEVPVPHSEISDTKKERKYPIGFYAPGSYMCKCTTCGIQFIGDKRAVQCEPCAVKMVSGITIETLLDYLAQYGGRIISTGSLTAEEIELARSSGRMYVDENYLGYVWIPSEVKKESETSEGKEDLIRKIHSHLYNAIPAGEINGFKVIQAVAAHLKWLESIEQNEKDK